MSPILKVSSNSGLWEIPHRQAVSNSITKGRFSNFFLIKLPYGMSLGFPGGSVVKKQKTPFPMQETWVQSLGREDPLEKEMVTHSSIFAWGIP